MRGNAQTDAAAPRFINHAGNPAVPGLTLENGPRTGSFAPSPFGEFALITLCKIAQCEPQCQRNGGVFARFLHDLAHIRAYSSNGRQSGECDAKRAAQSCRHYKPAINA